MPAESKARKLAIVFDTIKVEGSLISPAMLAQIAQHQADGQSEADYEIPKGLSLRDEIARYFRIGQAQLADFAKKEDPSHAQTVAFVKELLRTVFGFGDVKRVDTRVLGERQFAVTLEALKGRVPILVVPPRDDLDRPSDDLPTDGRRRSAASALQDWLNANGEILWGLCTNGRELRLVRDNASLTRPAYIEADIRRIFEAEAFADFAALWLLIHASRFGEQKANAADCALERWREEGAKVGVAARDRLRDGVEAALVSLGNGFLAHSANGELRRRLQNGELTLPDYFGQLLRLVYRLIFLLAAEDRDLLHLPNANAAARKLYAEGYSVSALRDRAVRRTAWDKHHDKWEGLGIVFLALARGEKRLGLPALDGLFGASSIPDLEKIKLQNRHLMEAIYRLAWLREPSGVVPVNWRDMETEELGSVYESLLELTPRLTEDGNGFAFAEGDESKGHARKTTGSYYTPDSLVQALLDSALDPVLDRVESDGDDPAKALLTVTVIDPACGSGHFLLAAARRIATRIARARTDGVAAAADYRHALRDVVRACIFGVDRNPMAVELTKVALWIETVEPGKPLGFLDANIRCGDALLGVFDLKALEKGIPDDAYKPLTGDDRETANHFRARNRAETSGQGSLDFFSGAGVLPAPAPLANEAKIIRAMPEDSPEEIAAKRNRYESVRADPRSWQTRVAADLYIAAFLAPKTGGVPTNRNTVTIPTAAHVWDALAGRQVYGPLIGRAQELAAEARALHWPLEFPDILATGGFDVVVGNPPWERVKLQEEEFFASRDIDIANAKNAAARKKLIAALPQTNPSLAQEWAEALRQAAVESNFFRLSGRFPLGGVGDVNTYAVFADLFRQLTNANGAAGLLLPSGLVTGFTYRAFLKHLLETKTLVSFFGFENEDKIFPDVHNETKFGILTIFGERQSINTPWFTAHIRQPAEIQNTDRRYSLTLEEIEAINPNTLNLPTFRWAQDAIVTAAIHKAAPVLIRRRADGEVKNPWQVKLRTLFHMANDSKHFIDHQEVSNLIKDRNAAIARLHDGREVFPLYEGKMFWHFDHRYGTYEGQTLKQANKGVLPAVTDSQHGNPNYYIQPRYWVDARLTYELLGDLGGSGWFFSWRDVGPSERTFIGAILPTTATGHVAPILDSTLSSEDRALLFGILSSLVVDYAARQKSKRMTFFVLEQIPVISLSKLNEQLQFLGSTAKAWLLERILELSYTNIELAKFAADLGRQHPPFRWDQDRRAILQAETDALLLHLYGLNREQAEWLLDSFTVLQKYEQDDLGEFRTKRLVLEIYDQIGAAQVSNSAYQTSLVPPPSHRDCCH